MRDRCSVADQIALYMRRLKRGDGLDFSQPVCKYIPGSIFCGAYGISNTLGSDSVRKSRIEFNHVTARYKDEEIANIRLPLNHVARVYLRILIFHSQVDFGIYGVAYEVNYSNNSGPRSFLEEALEDCILPWRKAFVMSSLNLSAQEAIDEVGPEIVRLHERMCQFALIDRLCEST